MVHYKSIDQSQFAEGTDIMEQEKVFDDFLQDSLLEIQGSHINNHFPIPYIFLKTCNRSEIYYGEGEVPDEVARHLFRVVAGLESAIIGETGLKAIRLDEQEANLEGCIHLLKNPYIKK